LPTHPHCDHNQGLTPFPHSVHCRLSLLLQRITGNCHSPICRRPTPLPHPRPHGCLKIFTVDQLNPSNSSPLTTRLAEPVTPGEVTIYVTNYKVSNINGERSLV